VWVCAGGSAPPRRGYAVRIDRRSKFTADVCGCVGVWVCGCVGVCWVASSLPSIFTDSVHSLRFASFIHSVCFAGQFRRLRDPLFFNYRRVMLWLSCGWGRSPRWFIERSYPSQGGGTPTRRRGAEPPLDNLHTET